MTFNDIVREINTLPRHQRKRLIKLLVDSLTEPTASEHRTTSLDFEGIDEPKRRGNDAQNHLDRLRNEWNH